MTDATLCLINWNRSVNVKNVNNHLHSNLFNVKKDESDLILRKYKKKCISKKRSVFLIRRIEKEKTK